MDGQTWWAFFGAACLIAISPGSGAVLSMSHGLSFGVRRTSATILGLQLGLLLILPAAIRLEAFEYLEKEQIALAYGVEGIVERQKQEYAPTYRRSMTQGVVLCVLAVVPILGTAMLGVPDFWVAAAVGLLLAIVAAIALTQRNRKDTKWVDPAVQVMARREDRVRIVKMQAVKREEEQATEDSAA